MSEQNSKLEQFSQKLSYEVKRKLSELKDSGDFATWTQLLETLIERYYSPKEADKKNLKRIAELEEEVKKLNGILEESQRKSAQENSRLSEVNTGLEHDYNELLIKHSELQQSHEACVLITPKNLAVLSYVAERETTKRKQPIDKNMIVNFLLETRFIKNKLSGGLDTVPAHILKKII
jgi:hypothetical protein